MTDEGNMVGDYATNLRNQIQDLKETARPVGTIENAIKFAEFSFPHEPWSIGHNDDTKHHYENWRYHATVGGKWREATAAGGDTPEKALTLAVLYQKLEEADRGG